MPQAENQNLNKKNLNKKDLLNIKVIEKYDTTYRIVSKNVTEYHFIVPYDLPIGERIEVGQICIHDVPRDD